MNDEATRYPLSWPNGWKRTGSHMRRRAAFHKNGERVTVGEGLRRLDGELGRLRAARVVISSNLHLRNDGLPYAQQARQLEDPGVAVYFKLSGKPLVLACDRWSSAAENMAAIAGHIAAMRAQDRYGVGSLDQAFAGYAALPANTAHDWRNVFGFEKLTTPTMAMVNEKYYAAAKQQHPDVGGSDIGMARLNEAREAAKAELRG